MSDTPVVVQDIISASEFLEKGACEKKSVLYFWADWHDASRPNGSFDTVFRSLASAMTESTEDPSSCNIEFFRVEAEAVPELSLKFSVEIVPTCILLSESKQIVNRVDGVDPAALTQAITSLSNNDSSSNTTVAPTESSQKNIDKSSGDSSDEKSLNDRLSSLIRSSEVMLFMKGVPSKPRCGFSRQICEILVDSKIQFGTFDILTDEEIRQGLKIYSDWPTYPQLYVRGELMGGLDVVKEMAQEAKDDGVTLAEQLELTQSNEPSDPESLLEDRLKKIVNRSRIMLFMKGLPSGPKCGFSRQIVEILDDESVEYDSFDILQDEDVRQGLKKLFNWPTYPQLYVDGDLVGGLDVVKELKEEEELSDLLKGE